MIFFSVKETENPWLCDVFTDGNLLFFNGKYNVLLMKKKPLVLVEKTKWILWFQTQNINDRDTNCTWKCTFYHAYMYVTIRMFFYD